ncbi:MAG: metallophosphoesterase family protein [Acidimicrobiales bacterium]
MTRVAVLADTHLKRGSARRLPAAALAEAAAADVILHAGDVTIPEALDELARLAPVHAVLGNNDAELVGALPERLELVLGGVRVALVHDSGASAGRAGRLRRWFPHAALVVFGHSHQPLDAAGAGGQILFNPGSPTERRRAPRHTMGRLLLRDGAVLERRLVEL